jgi:hypothetical protein
MKKQYLEVTSSLLRLIKWPSGKKDKKELYRDNSSLSRINGHINQANYFGEKLS